MICEVLCVLAGHKSSLFTDDAHVTPDFLPLLHPGEVQTLEALVGLASRFSKIRQAANHFRLLYSNYAIGLGSAKGPKDYVPSEYLSTLGAAILQVLREYEALVVKTEARVLHRDSELVGAKSFVSLSAIRAVFSIWDAPLVALDSLVDDLYAGPPGDLQQLQPVQRTERSEVPAWPPGPLIDTLLQRSRSGIHRVAEIMSQLAVAVQRLWRIHLTAFILHGSLSTSDPLAIESMTGKDAPSTPFAPTRPSSATSPKSISSLALNDRAIPSCITPQTRESILYLGKAVATVKGQGQAQKQFPRTMAVEHAAMLERVLPQDGFAFDRVISEIRATVSEFLWEHVLNERDVEEAVESLADYFLLRNGEFAVSLIREIERLKITRLTARVSARTAGIREQDLSLALLRASLGTHAQQDPSLSKIRFSMPSGPVRPYLGSSTNRTPAPSEFSDYLLGTPLILTYALEWPLDLFLVPADLQIYSHLFSYFSAIRRAQHITLECWTSLSNAQRSRRRWTGQNEGGTQDSQARMQLLRCGWGVLRQMLWFLDTLWGYLMNDVVSSQYRRFTAKLRPPAPLEPRITPSATAKTGSKVNTPIKTTKQTPTSTPEKLAAPKTASTPRPTTPVPQQRDEPHNTQRRSHHDFSSLRNLHSNYLYSLLTGALLGNATYASLIRGILDVCNQFVAQVERWGGDILPGLLSEGSLSAPGSDLGRTVRERWAIVREVNETLNELLQTFYKHLSENMSLGPTSGHPTEASMLLNASTTILGLNVFRAQRESKQGNGRIERDGIAERQVEHLLLRLDYNSAISAPLKAPAEDAENLLQGDLA